MGLFNVVKIDKKYPECGAAVEWQSKRLVVDGIYPLHNSLEIFELDKRRIQRYEKSFERFMNKNGRKTIW